MVKNTKAGNHVVKFSYCIIKRGPRPIVPDEVRGEGRMGEVGREMAEKAMEKKASVVAQGSDGVYASELGEEEGGHERENQAEIPEADMEKLRQEVQEWGRMIYPPLHKKGHISMDLCTSSGSSLIRPDPFLLPSSAFVRMLTLLMWSLPRQHSTADHRKETARPPSLVRRQALGLGRRHPSRV
jgi:hypothetical protein